MASSLAEAILRRFPAAAGDHRDVCRFHEGERILAGVCPLCQAEAQAQDPAPEPAPLSSHIYKLRESGHRPTASSFSDAVAYRRAGERVAFVTDLGGGWFQVETRWAGTAPRKVAIQGAAAMRRAFPAPGFIRVYRGASVARRVASLLGVRS